MDAHGHTWPVWTVALLALAASLWISELPLPLGVEWLMMGHG